MIEKKRKVEEAILKASQKNPELKITKARLLGKSFWDKSLKSIIFFFAFFAFLSLKENCHAENASNSVSRQKSDGAGSIVFDSSKLPLEDTESGKKTTDSENDQDSEENDEKAKSIFDYDFGDTNVEFLAEGYWKSTVSSTTTSTFGFGTTPALSLGTPVFTQNVDLSLWFMVNRKWYFGAAFAEEFDKNTVEAGYIGEGTLKSAKIANRGIIFPSIYSVSTAGYGIGGGDNQAPGFSINFKSENWQADATVRYDMLLEQEKNWYGKNQVSTTNIELSEWHTGSMFVLPTAEDITNVQGVYVESSTGTFKDSQGRKYKKLDSSQYLLSAANCTVYISKDAKAGKTNGKLPAVAFEFNSAGITKLNSNLGEFGTKSEPGSGFLGEIQKWFCTENVASYSYGKLTGNNRGGDSTGLETQGFFDRIDSEAVLFVQHPAGFSPFQVANRYDLGITKATDAKIASKTTEDSSASFSVQIADTDSTFTENDFFNTSHTYADVFLTESTASNASEDSTLVSPKVRFPFANTKPEIYLGFCTNEDLVLRIRSYTQVSRFEIGTNAVAGTVRVYKNNVLDAGATYNQDEGTITLSSGVGSGDHIRAVWSEDSESTEQGAIAVAAGFKYDFSNAFSLDLSAASRWALSAEKKYADDEDSAQGFVALASSAVYKKNNFEAKNTASVALENQNTTGNYRILGMDDDTAESSYLSKKAGISLPDGFAPVLVFTESGSSKTIELDAQKNGSVEPANGSTDSKISGYAISAEWNFSNISGTEDSPAWAATTISTPALKNKLSNATALSMAFKSLSSLTDVKVFLQLGVSGEEDFSYEDSLSLPTWKIFDSETKTSGDGAKITQKDDSEWEVVTVTLSNEDRSHINELQNYNARIIVTKNQDSQVSTGFLKVGPYEVEGITFQAVSENAETKNYQTKDSSLSNTKIKEFNSTTNYVQYFEWEYETEVEEDEIEFIRYFEDFDFSPYKKLNFFFKHSSSNSDFEFILERSGDSAKEAVYISILKEQLANFSTDSWHSLALDLQTHALKIDGQTISATVRSKSSVMPNRFKIRIKNYSPEAANFSIDELYFSENSPYFVFQDKAKIAYKKPGEILSIKNFSILKDFSIGLSGNASKTTSENSETLAQGNGEVSAVIMNLKVDLSAAKASENTGLTSGAHKISTEKPILNFLSASEEYNFLKDEESLEKTDSLKLDFSRIKFPFILESNFSSNSDEWSKNQAQNSKISFNSKYFEFLANGKTSQKLSDTENYETENYFSSYKQISALEFSKGESDASKRTVSLNSKASGKFDFLKLKPALAFSSDGTYKKTTATVFTDKTSFECTLPFSIQKNSFSLSWKKSTGGVKKTEAGGDYFSDADKLFAPLSEREWFLKAMPIYDLLSDNLASSVLADATMDSSSTESLYYSSNYAAVWKRNFFATKYDFFIPSSVKLNLTRDIKTASSVADSSQIKLTSSHAAANVFGSTGTIKKFDWYEQDEYTASLSAAVKLPRDTPDNFSVLLGSYVQAVFFITQKEYVKTGFEISFEDKYNWTGKSTFIWKRYGKITPLFSIIELFKPDLRHENHKLTRTDSLNFLATSSSSSSEITKKYKVDLNHELEIQVTKFISVNTSAGINYNATWDKIASLGASFSAGCTVKF